MCTQLQAAGVQVSRDVSAPQLGGWLAGCYLPDGTITSRRPPYRIGGMALLPSTHTSKPGKIWHAPACRAWRAALQQQQPRVQ